MSVISSMLRVRPNERPDAGQLLDMVERLRPDDGKEVELIHHYDTQESQVDLLATINLPRDLKLLDRRLPRSNYPHAERPEKSQQPRSNPPPDQNSMMFPNINQKLMKNLPYPILSKDSPQREPLKNDIRPLRSLDPPLYNLKSDNINLRQLANLREDRPTSELPPKLQRREGSALPSVYARRGDSALPPVKNKFSPRPDVENNHSRRVVT